MNDDTTVTTPSTDMPADTTGQAPMGNPVMPTPENNGEVAPQGDATPNEEAPAEQAPETPVEEAPAA